MRKSSILLSLALGLSATVFAQSPTRYEIDVKDFSFLSVTDGVNVDYVCSPDSAGKAVFYATPDVASQIIFKPGKEKLEIQLVPKDERVNRAIPTVRVYSTYLTQVENAGDSLVRVLSVYPGPKFSARVIGNGRISARAIDASNVFGTIDTGKGILVLFGKCTDAKLRCVGTGSIQADGLQAVNASCDIYGTGTIGCNAKETLSVTGAGSGKVYYDGNPSIKKRGVGLKVLSINEREQ